MANMTNFLEKKLLDHTLGKASWTMPTTVYMGLFTSDPGEVYELVRSLALGEAGKKQPLPE